MQALLLTDHREFPQSGRRASVSCGRMVGAQGGIRSGSRSDGTGEGSCGTRAASPDGIPLNLRGFRSNRILRQSAAAAAGSICGKHPADAPAVRQKSAAESRETQESPQREQAPSAGPGCSCRIHAATPAGSTRGEQQAEHRAVGLGKAQLAQLFECDPAERRHGTGQIGQLRSQNTTPEMEFHLALRTGMLNRGKVLSRNHQQAGFFPAFPNSAGTRRLVGLAASTRKLRLSSVRTASRSLPDTDSPGRLHDGDSDAYSSWHALTYSGCGLWGAGARRMMQTAKHTSRISQQRPPLFQNRREAHPSY